MAVGAACGRSFSVRTISTLAGAVKGAKAGPATRRPALAGAPCYLGVRIN
jgi:hypothetical protein